jgi:hypothetical protein
MNRRRNYIALALILTLLTSQSALAAGKTSVTIKKAGRATTLTPNTILSGSGVPSKTTGIDGDFYIDTKNANLYGPKTKGAWKIATSLRIKDSREIVTPSAGANGAKGDRGEQGITGPDGAVGAKGATGLTGAVGATGLTGAVGLTGVAGLVGATGISGGTGMPGANGLKGDTGVAGATGATGSSGTNGTAGSIGATGATGATGSNGTNGTAGAIGATGPTGAAGSIGATGPTGPAGVSNSFFIDIQQWTLSTGSNLGVSDSSAFGTLVSGASYTFEIMLDGTFSPGTATAMMIGMQLIPSVTPTSIQYRVFASDSTTFINGFGGRHYQFVIMGTIVCASSLTTLTLRAVDQYGSTRVNALSFTGKALLNKVGAIG